MAETRVYIRVYYKSEWAAPWVLQPYWEAISASHIALPGISAAQIMLRFGEGMWEDGAAMDNGSVMESRLFGYVQIRACINETENAWWTGVIPAESMTLLGKRTTGIETVDQIVTAYGLEYLLQRRIWGSRVERVDDAAGTLAHQIDPVLTFNRRHDKGGEILGNRSSDSIKVADDPLDYAYVFSADGAEWTNWNIIDYLIRTQVDTNGVRWAVYGNNQPIVDALSSVIGVYDFDGQTVLNAINTLISPSRGFSWRIYVDFDTEGAEYAVIKPYSLLETELTIGDFTIPANDTQYAYDPWADPTQIVNIEHDTTTLYDKIVVRGAKIKSCFTAKVSGEVLEKAWTDTEETAYLDAAKLAAGYSALTSEEKGQFNDLFRSTDRFERVFTSFRIPADWNWMIGAEYANIKLDANGDLIAAASGEYFNPDKRLLNYLPFKQGWDYSGASAVNKNPSYAEEEFQTILAWFTQSSKKVQADKVPQNGAHVRPLQREFGVEVKFNPQHLAALNQWAGAEPTLKVPEVSETIKAVDWETLGITAMVETDTYLAVESTLDDYSTAEGRRTLVIDAPDCELWYVVAGTVIGINSAGEEIAYGGSSAFVRDDRDKLRAILAAAKTWYHKRRTKLTIQKEGIAYPYLVGSILIVPAIGTDSENCSSVVSAINWNFNSGQTMITTGFAEQDFKAIAGGRGTRGTPTLHTAAKQIDGLTRQVREIKSELGKSPVRIGQSAGATAAAEEASITWAEIMRPPDAGEDYYTIKITAWEDDWAAATWYDADDKSAWNSGTYGVAGNSNTNRVSHGGKLYKSIHASNTNKEPGVAADWATYWEEIQVSVVTYEYPEGSGREWTCITSHLSEAGKEPPNDETDWEEVDSTKAYAIGTPGWLLTCLPVFCKGKFIPVVSSDSGDGNGERYYLRQTFIQGGYVEGTGEELVYVVGSLAWLTDASIAAGGRAAAVFR